MCIVNIGTKTANKRSVHRQQVGLLAKHALCNCLQVEKTCSKACTHQTRS